MMALIPKSSSMVNAVLVGILLVLTISCTITNVEARSQYARLLKQSTLDAAAYPGARRSLYLSTARSRERYSLVSVADTCYCGTRVAWAHHHWVWLANSQANQTSEIDLVNGYLIRNVPV